MLADYATFLAANRSPLISNAPRVELFFIGTAISAIGLGIESLLCPPKSGTGST